MNIDKRKHGYLVIPRQAKLLAEELGNPLFGFYLRLVMEAHWDRRNEKFGLVTMTQKELADKLYMEQTIISRWLSKLEKHKDAIVNHTKNIRVGFFPLFLADVAFKIHNKNYANLHELYADVYSINAELQENQAQNNHQSLYISSNNVGSNSSLEGEIDIDEIAKELDKEESNNG